MKRIRPVIIVYAVTTLICIIMFSMLIKFVLPPMPTNTVDVIVTWFFGIVLVALTSCVLSLWMEMMLTGEIPANSAVVKDGKIIREFINRHVFWWREYENVLDGGRILTAHPAPLSVRMHVQPITDNPKVRDLWYVLKIQLDESPRRALALQHVLEKWKHRGIKNAEDLVQYMCYELHEHMSKKLARFFNPKDSSQQYEFGKTVRSFFWEKFDGLVPFSFTEITFGLD